MMSEKIENIKKKHRKGLGAAAVNGSGNLPVGNPSGQPGSKFIGQADRGKLKEGPERKEKYAVKGLSSVRGQKEAYVRDQKYSYDSELKKRPYKAIKAANKTEPAYSYHASDSEKRSKYKENKNLENSGNKNIENKDKSSTDKRIQQKSGYAARMNEGRLPDNKKSSAGKAGCSYIKKCGGCQVQQSDYGKHLDDKQKTVESLIKKYCKVENIIGMEKPYHYRNKVHAVFDHDKKGNPISGIYEEGTHRVIPIDSCMIEDKKADEIIVSIRGLLKSFKIKTYDEDTEYGLLRHVLIRKGFTSGEIMVVLVLSSPIFPSKNNFVKALRQLHPEITTIILNVNDKKTSMVLGEKEHVIYGKGFIEDTLCGKVFRISPKSFYQINPVQTEVLYGKAIELAGLTGMETVIDAYCGIGTIGLIASDHSKKVIGVELNKDAVRDAVLNAKRNEVTNIEFYNNDSGDFMSGMAARGENADIVFMDPPRAGSDEKFLNALIQIKPKKIVYISCNPVTLERDLASLTKKGYQAATAVPVDMFPWTEHVEVIILLQRL